MDFKFRIITIQNILFVFIIIVLTVSLNYAQGKYSKNGLDDSVNTTPILKNIDKTPVFLYFTNGKQLKEKLSIPTSQIVPLGAIHLYKKIISPYLGGQCYFHPSCSEYASRAYQKYNFITATMMTADRLSRDHGFFRLGDYPLYGQKHFYDPVKKFNRNFNKN